MRLNTQKKPLLRLYRISIKSALVISLPFFILTAWMVYDAILEYKRFTDYVDPPSSSPSLNTTILHWHLRENLKRSYNKIFSSSMPEYDQLPLMQMSIAPEILGELNRSLPESGWDRYYKSFIKYKDKSYTVKTRYRGAGHWHWNYPKKSWRIKTKKEKLIDGHRKLNLVNPKTVLSFEEAFSMELANEIGLLAPKCDMVKLVVNNQYVGIYYLLEKVDESILRRNNRMPGSIYSDNGSTIWKNSNSWKKDASRSAEKKDYRRDIEKLINALNQFELTDYYDYARKHINIDKYSLYLAFDNISGTAHHDYEHNFILYFDPILGNFEFLPWDQHLWHPTFEVGFDMANPPLNKWKMIPEFDLIRHKTLWRLLNNELTVSRMVSLLDRYLEKVRPGLAADRYKDAISPTYRNILKFENVGVGTFTMENFDYRAKKFRNVIVDRHKFLSDYLEDDEIYAYLEKGDSRIIKFTSCGNVASKVDKIEFDGSGSGNLFLYKDLDRDGTVDDSDPVIGSCMATDNKCIIKLDEVLYPGYKVEKRIPPSPLWGDTILVPNGLEYQFLIKGDFSINTFKTFAINDVTKNITNVHLSPPPDSKRLPSASLHPWDLPVKQENTKMVLGPGIIQVEKNMIIPEHVELKIEPGTTFMLSEGTSIFCYGKVLAQGVSDNPIIFKAADIKKPWGVFALQGSGADNSIFAWCNWQDGSIASRNLIDYSGMVSMHDVDNLSIKNCRIGPNHIGDDGLHLAYCKKFLVYGSLFEDARSDAMDVDISDGNVVLNRFLKSGNDALDFMTSAANVDQCYFLSSGDKGISAGENSKLVVDRSVFELCNIGMEIKDRSVVDFKKNVIRNSPLAINIYKKNWRYNGGGKLLADTVFVIDCLEGIKFDKKSEALIGKIETKDSFASLWNDTKKSAGRNVPLDSK